MSPDILTFLVQEIGEFLGEPLEINYVDFYDVLAQLVPIIDRFETVNVQDDIVVGTIKFVPDLVLNDDLVDGADDAVFSDDSVDGNVVGQDVIATFGQDVGDVAGQSDVSTVINDGDQSDLEAGTLYINHLNTLPIFIE